MSLALTGGMLVLALAAPQDSLATESEVRVATRRVPISFSFSGQEVFVSGRLPPGADSALAIMQGPMLGSVRLMQKGRRGLFWMGVRQYELEDVPGLYLVNLHCPQANGMGECQDGAGMKALGEALAASGVALGEPAIVEGASIEVLDGESEPGELERVVAGFWKMQAARGLYGIRDNAIRITPDQTFYHVFNLPTAAPEGKYRIRTYFLSGSTLVAVVRNELFVRQSGLVNWLSRLAERRATAYGLITIAIALGAGLLAGTLFKRAAKH